MVSLLRDLDEGFELVLDQGEMVWSIGFEQPFFRGGSLTPGPGRFSLSGERLGGEPLVGEGLYWGA